MTDDQGLAESVEVARRVVRLAGRLQAVVADALEEQGVSGSAGGVLWALGDPAAPPTLRDVAARLGCDPSTVSLTTDRLETAGLVVRAPHPRDGRKRVLVLTDRGTELWSEVARRLHASLSGLDAQSRRTLVDLLGRTPS